MPRNEGGVGLAVGEHADSTLDNKEVNPGVRATPKLVMRGVRGNEVERIGANGIMKMDGVGKGHVHVEVTCDDIGGVKSKMGNKAVEKMNRLTKSRRCKSRTHRGQRRRHPYIPSL